MPFEQSSVEALYAAAYQRLVGVTGAICGDRAEAEEAVQDAFVRLIGRWDTIRSYDDPEAWVRRVALGKVSNARRKRRNGLLAVSRLRPPDATEPSTDPLDLQRALAQLPRDQRAVVVLRQLGLELAEIAHELGVPLGTVKSRLSRAHAALRPLLTDEVHDRA